MPVYPLPTDFQFCLSFAQRPTEWRNISLATAWRGICSSCGMRRLPIRRRVCPSGRARRPCRAGLYDAGAEVRCFRCGEFWSPGVRGELWNDLTSPSLLNSQWRKQRHPYGICSLPTGLLFLTQRAQRERKERKGFWDRIERI